MSLKPQDIVILCKILSKKNKWTQNGIAAELFLSPSQINGGIKRLVSVGLLSHYTGKAQPNPIHQSCEEFFVHVVKYLFPAKLGEISRGVPTSYASHLKKEIHAGNDPIPVWPYAEGKKRGVALKPLYHAVPKSVEQYPDPIFYEYLGLIDAIRSGRARERKLACEKIVHLLRK